MQSADNTVKAPLINFFELKTNGLHNFTMRVTFWRRKQHKFQFFERI